MNTKQLLVLGASVLASSLSGPAVAQETQGQMQRQMQGQYVQVAEIEIDPAQLEEYRELRLGSKSTLLFAWSREFWCYTPCLKKTIRLVSGFSKSIGIRMRTSCI